MTEPGWEGRDLQTGHGRCNVVALEHFRWHMQQQPTSKETFPYIDEVKSRPPHASQGYSAKNPVVALLNSVLRTLFASCRCNKVRGTLEILSSASLGLRKHRVPKIERSYMR